MERGVAMVSDDIFFFNQLDAAGLELPVDSVPLLVLVELIAPGAI